VIEMAGKPIKNEKVVDAFKVISDGEDYNGTLSNALLLLAYVVDSAGRLEGKPRRIQVKTTSDGLSVPYRITIEELIKTFWGEYV